jgi:hypothetical protein
VPFSFLAYQYGQRNDMVITTILEESPNGYSVTTKAPFEMTAAIKHYTKMLRRFTLDFPEEWALCHYSLGKIFASDNPNQERSKCMSVIIFHLLPNIIAHFRLPFVVKTDYFISRLVLKFVLHFSHSLIRTLGQIFTPEGFPTMSALISLFEASLSR